MPGDFLEIVLADAQVFGHQRVILELERRAHTRQIVEFPARLRFAYALLDECIQGEQDCV